MMGYFVSIRIHDAYTKRDKLRKSPSSSRHTIHDATNCRSNLVSVVIVAEWQPNLPPLNQYQCSPSLGYQSNPPLLSNSKVHITSPLPHRTKGLLSMDIFDLLYHLLYIKACNSNNTNNIGTKNRWHGAWSAVGVES